MANPTTYFGWVMPTSSSLVTNLPADFNTFGQGVDTSLQDLLGGTTGQVLSKTSATNMDFTWVTPTDQTPLTTKGDLFTFTTVDARLAVGSNGETLVADSSTSTGLRWQGDYAGAKNAILNGAFNVFQRGTSISYTGSGAVAYDADRFYHYSNGNGAWTFSQQALTPGSISGYESPYFARASLPTAGTTTSLNWGQRIENVQTYAGQTATLSFWAKADSARTINWFAQQNFGSGGSATVDTSTSNFSITTSWTRFSVAISIPSITGKTIGAGSYLAMFINAGSITNGFALDIWGVQLEAGSVATAFQTATGTIQGELAACQRYFQVIAVSQAWGTWYATDAAALMAGLPVAMRVTPTATFSTVYTNAIVEVGVTDRTPTAYAAYKTSNQAFSFLATGMTTSATIRQGAVYIGPNHLLSAEL